MRTPLPLTLPQIPPWFRLKVCTRYDDFPLLVPDILCSEVSAFVPSLKKIPWATAKLITPKKLNQSFSIVSTLLFGYRSNTGHIECVSYTSVALIFSSDSWQKRDASVFFKLPNCSFSDLPDFSCESLRVPDPQAVDSTVSSDSQQTWTHCRYFAKLLRNYPSKQSMIKPDFYNAII